MASAGVDGRRACLYLPVIPSKENTTACTYDLSVRDAPLHALMGVLADGKEVQQLPKSSRCRTRKQVGYTNRWRLPGALRSDLLGSAQALRSVATTRNNTFTSIVTAESPQMAMHVNEAEPYRFSYNTSPFPEKATSKSLRRSKDIGRSPEPTIRSRPLSTCIPTTAKPDQPQDIFYFYKHRSSQDQPSDVLLHCLNMKWELHYAVLHKSPVLTALLKDNSLLGPLKANVDRSNIDAAVQNFTDKLDLNDLGTTDEKCVKEMKERQLVIRLRVNDPSVTPTALAIALGHLYHDNTDLPTSQLVAILATATLLRFQHLITRCIAAMVDTINTQTVSAYHSAALMYGQEFLKDQTERWLELNLVSQLFKQIQLRFIPQSLLMELIKSDRLFVYNEYSVYLVVVYWLFLQMNPMLQLMPSFSTILTYFNSLPKTTCLLDRSEGYKFLPLFAAIRLHGITEMAQVKDVQAMNIIPQSWIINIMNQHYHSLQSGGDMSLMNNFTTGSLRKGFIMDHESQFHAEIFSLHGFHFELKAVRLNDRKTYSFFLQRLKPSDPVLSYRHCERNTFSMRPDREVWYDVTIQCVNPQASKYQLKSTGKVVKRFGLGSETSRSEVHTFEQLHPPLYVRYSLLLPPS